MECGRVCVRCVFVSDSERRIHADKKVNFDQMIHRPEPQESDEQNRKMLSALGARYITYDELIRQTRESYADYLDKNEKLSRIQRFLEKI